MRRTARTQRKFAAKETRAKREKLIKIVSRFNEEHTNLRFSREDAALIEFFKRKGYRGDEPFHGDKYYNPQIYSTILHAARRELGILKGKKILLVSERNFFSEFLTEVEQAQVTTHNEQVQSIGISLKENNFDAIMANNIFQYDAFRYDAKPDPALFGPIRSGRDSLLIDRDLSLGMYNELLKIEPEKKKPIMDFVRKRFRERANILSQFASKLKRGGVIIISCQNNKVLFKPQEATTAGLRIVKMNYREVTGPLNPKEQPYSYTRNKWYLTVLQKR